MEQIVIITSSQSTINEHLRSGWRVKSVTAQHVVTGSTSQMRGDFCFVLEKNNEHK